MFAALTQFFMMFATLFSAGQKTASALDHLATFADESAATFADEARQTRQQKLLKLKAQTASIQKDPLAAVAEDNRVTALLATQANSALAA